MTDFATRTFRCPECGNTEFYCYPQTVVVGREKHDWEYTCTKCKCVTVLITVEWRPDTLYDKAYKKDPEQTVALDDMYHSTGMTDDEYRAHLKIIAEAKE